MVSDWDRLAFHCTMAMDVDRELLCPSSYVHCAAFYNVNNSKQYKEYKLMTTPPIIPIGADGISFNDGIVMAVIAVSETIATAAADRAARPLE